MHQSRFFKALIVNPASESLPPREVQSLTKVEDNLGKEITSLGKRK